MHTKPFTPAQKSRLIALEAQLDQKLFGQHFDQKTGKMVDDDSIMPSAGTVAGVAAAGAAGYGGYKADAAIRNRMGGMNALREAGAPRATYGDAFKDLIGQGKGAVKSAADTAGTAIATGAGDIVKGGRRMVRGALLKTARAVGR